MGWLLERCDLPRLADRLMAGEVGAYLVAGTDAAIVLSVARAAPDNTRTLWVESLGGKASSKPKENTAILAEALAECEMIARASECSEIRIEAGSRTNLKRRLFTKFGFEVFTFDRFEVLRKAL
jgi:hypothetical protein